SARSLSKTKNSSVQVASKARAAALPWSRRSWERISAIGSAFDHVLKIITAEIVLTVRTDRHDLETPVGLLVLEVDYPLFVRLGCWAVVQVNTTTIMSAP
ncbi:MAG: hypothetical protein QGH20_08220, partial [Candidatus Latescibacteria bacterium]|nr:hypothetical protein [Candidatus Latescibacterota bacterium]